MRALVSLLNTVLGSIGLTLKPWMAPAFLLVILMIMAPMYKANYNTRQARRLLGQAWSSSRAADRDRLKAEALALVKGNPIGIAVVAEEAIKNGWKDLATQAINELEQTKARPDELRSLRRRLEGERGSMAESEAIAVENLLQAGLKEQAATRLHAALERWPKAEVLRDLQGRLDEPPQA